MKRITRQIPCASPLLFKLASGSTYLNNSGVLRQRASGFGWLTDCEVFDVTSSEYDVLKHLISRWDRSVSGSVLGTKRANC